MTLKSWCSTNSFNSETLVLRCRYNRNSVHPQRLTRVNYSFCQGWALWHVISIPNYSRLEAGGVKQQFCCLILPLYLLGPLRNSMQSSRLPANQSLVTYYRDTPTLMTLPPAKPLSARHLYQCNVKVEGQDSQSQNEEWYQVPPFQYKDKIPPFKRQPK